MVRALFSPRMIGLHLLAVLAVGTAGWLGFWQYDAWQTHRAAQAEDLAHAEPRPLDRVMSSDDPFPADSVGRPVEFHGVWVPESTVYVADRRHDGRSGFWVVTPAAVCSDDCHPKDDPAMLVVRGWSPRPTAAAVPAEDVELTGWLQPSEGSGLTDPDPSDDVLPEVRIADALQHVDQDLYGGYVISQDPTPGLTAVTPDSLPEPEALTGLRNLLYAVEWWVFGGFAFFVWWRWCSDEVRRTRAGVLGDDPDDNAATATEDPSTARVPSGP